MTAKKARNGSSKRGVLRVYKSYLFRDKDPIIDAIRTLRQDAGRSYKQIEEDGGPTKTTTRNWERGKTKRPQFSSVWAAIRTLGGKGITVGEKGYPRIEK